MGPVPSQVLGEWRNQYLVSLSFCLEDRNRMFKNIVAENTSEAGRLELVKEVGAGAQWK